MRYPFLRNDPGGDVDIEITADGLCFTNDGGRSAVVPFSQIAEVWLFCALRGRSPILFEDDRPTVFCCRLKFTGGRLITLTSEGAPSDSYRAFMRLLHERLEPTRRRTRFRAGLECVRFLAWLFLEAPAAHLSFGSVYLPLLPFCAEGRLVLRRNFPRRYRPDMLPHYHLP